MNKKSILFAGAMALALTGAFADDFDDFGDFGGFGDDFGSDSSSTPAVVISGAAGTEIRGYVDVDNADDITKDASVDAKLNVEYSGSKSDVLLSLKFDEDTIKNNPADVIDELVVRGYFGNFVLEGGKMKVVWGKGDKLHVLDNFNADDYSDFIFPDYIDRRISTPMVRGVYNFGKANLSLEAVYTPFLPKDKFATEGRWTPAQVNGLTVAVKTASMARLSETVENLEQARLLAAQASTLQNLIAQNDAEALLAMKQQVSEAVSSGLITVDADKVKALVLGGASLADATAAVAGEAYAAYVEENLRNATLVYTLALNNASALQNDVDIIYPDMSGLKYSQYGARLTGTVGQIDWGLSYYNGFYKQPSVDFAKIGTWTEKYLAGTVTEEDKFLAYDKKQTFGLEASTVLWHFNLRGEAGYNLTKDTAGDDPAVHNNSVCWLGGFDIDLPIWNMNVNVQETGTLILKSDDVDKNPFDVDYCKNGYTNNKVVVNVTTSFVNDKLVPEATVMYGIENGDLVVIPKLTYSVADGLKLSASGMYLWNKDEFSEFASWKDNSFVNLGISYQF